MPHLFRRVKAASVFIEVHTDRNDILSISYYDLGCAHPIITRQSRTFDTADEKELALYDVVNGYAL